MGVRHGKSLIRGEKLGKIRVKKKSGIAIWRDIRMRIRKGRKEGRRRGW